MDYATYLDKFRGRIQSACGKWIGGEDVIIRDYSLFDDLFNQISYIQLVVLNITGRLISAELGKWIENNFMCTSFPDARIWCNNVAALCGRSQTSPTAGTTAGILAADSVAYSCQTIKLTMEMLKAVDQKISTGVNIDEVIAEFPIKRGKPAVPGFVRPVNKPDERIEPLKKMTTSLGFDVGHYMQLANQISKVMNEKCGAGINLGGYTSAFFLDQGFTPDEGYQIKSISVASGATACFVDNLGKPENTYLPLRCEDINYTGQSARQVNELSRITTKRAV